MFEPPSRSRRGANQKQVHGVIPSTTLRGHRWLALRHGCSAFPGPADLFSNWPVLPGS
jgi:hypothetical protein